MHLGICFEKAVPRVRFIRDFCIGFSLTCCDAEYQISCITCKPAIDFNRRLKLTIYGKTTLSNGSMKKQANP